VADRPPTLQLPGVGPLPLDFPLTAARVLARTGWLRPVWPQQLAGLGLALARWRVSPATGYAAGATRWPDRIAVIDEREALTFAEVDRRAERVAAGLAGLGLDAGGPVGLLVRNSSVFCVCEAALAKLGADVCYLNTGWSPPQFAGVLDDERLAGVVADAEFLDALRPAAAGRPLVVGWADDGPPPADLPGVADWLSGPGGPGGPDGSAASPAGAPRWVRRTGRHVILTSGTTGRPKGAARKAPGGLTGLVAVVSLLSAIPLAGGDTTVLAAPMFHAWGLLHFSLALAVQSTLVLDRRFDPERTLARIAEHRARVLVAVPVMLQRILELPERTLDRYDTSCLEVVAVSGSALPAAVAERFRTRFGDVLYNLYGSTEVALATVAGPADFRAAPGSVGRPLPGVRLRIVGDGGRRRPAGETGRIFVGSGMSFEGYTGGQDKDRVDGLVGTGDLGHLDADGRLWVDGRDDEMIVSGGENVFPAEVEDCLAAHPQVAEVAVGGVPDERFGSRLAAHVVAADRRPDPAQLQRWVKERLAGYKVPRDVVFHEALPRNPTGKVVKGDLPRPGPQR
jgi:acyl-CoA synthetase (AMP-forming)/AMP-acid ligase II